jgi:hypothetical protein
MASAAIWTAIIAVPLALYWWRNPATPFKPYAMHVFFAWLLVQLNYRSLGGLRWALQHSDEWPAAFVKPLGAVPAELNLLIWGLSSMLGLVALCSALPLAAGSNAARRWCVRLVPLLGAALCADLFRYMTDTPSFQAWSGADVVASIFVAGLAYIPLWRFYRGDPGGIFSNAESAG